MTEILKNFLSGGETEAKEIEGIQGVVNAYRYNKMHATGYSFFASVTDKLSCITRTNHRCDCSSNVFLFSTAFNGNQWI